MNGIISDNLYIDASRKSLYMLKYETDEFIYRIKLIHDLYGYYTPVLYLTYRESWYNRRFVSQLQHKIPSKHCEIVKQLFNIYEDRIILPMKLIDNIKYKNELVFGG